MKNLHCTIFLLFFMSSILLGQKQVILDTDPSADPDDVGCMAMLHNMATNGECEILAIINSTHYKESSLSISALMSFTTEKPFQSVITKGIKKK